MRTIPSSLAPSTNSALRPNPRLFVSRFTTLGPANFPEKGAAPMKIFAKRLQGKTTIDDKLGPATKGGWVRLLCETPYYFFNYIPRLLGQAGGWCALGSIKRAIAPIRGAVAVSFSWKTTAAIKSSTLMYAWHTSIFPTCVLLLARKGLSR